MTHGLYEVTGRFAYRGHAPGTRFEASLSRPAERRAIARGDIRLVERVTPSIRAGSYKLPDGWAAAVNREAPGTGRLERRL